MIETERLILRPYRDADRAPLAAMNGDPRVAEWLAGPLTSEASDALIDRLQAHIVEAGWGFWAAERRADGQVIGMVGLAPPGVEGIARGRAVELAWRLAFEAWGQGYAVEGAKAAFDWARDRLELDEVIAITAQTNLRSQAVMRRVGLELRLDRSFDHPRVPIGSPLRRHVLFAVDI